MADAGAGIIEVDPALLADGKSDYESSGYDSSTQSLTSSINHYIFENGRRYHAYFGTEKYLIPTDEEEQIRLDMHHEIFLILLDRKLHLAPISDNPHKILDVGTGTGIWAIDMAEKYPSAEVIGVDLSPIQPPWVPPNCRFEADDVEKPWGYKDDSMDLVHIRNVAQSITDWPKLLKAAYSVIKPGGWIELSEIELTARCDDGTMTDDNGTKRFLEKLTEGMGMLGRVPVDGKNLERNLKDAGFKNTRIVRRKQPLGPWPKDPDYKQAGAMSLLGGRKGYHSYGMALFTRVMGMSEEEADNLCEEAATMCANKNQHTWIWYYVVIGQKPSEPEGGA